MPAAPRVAPAALAVSPAAATRAQRGVGARDPLLSRCCSSADPAVGACAGPIGLHGGGDRDRWPVAANARCEQSPTLVYALREFPKWTSIPPTSTRSISSLEVQIPDGEGGWLRVGMLNELPPPSLDDLDTGLHVRPVCTRVRRCAQGCWRGRGFCIVDVRTALLLPTTPLFCRPEFLCI